MSHEVFPMHAGLLMPLIVVFQTDMVLMNVKSGWVPEVGSQVKADGGPLVEARMTCFGASKSPLGP